MSITLFNQTQISQVPSIEDVVKSIVNNARSDFDTICKMQRASMKAFWHNEYYTPAQLAEELDVVGGKMFQAHSALTQALFAIAGLEGVAPPVALPTREFTIADSGVVTIIEPPPPVDPPPEEPPPEEPPPVEPPPVDPPPEEPPPVEPPLEEPPPEEPPPEEPPPVEPPPEEPPVEP